MKKITIILSTLIFLMPLTSYALVMPTSGNDLASMAGISAQAYVVTNADTGEVLIAKNPDLAWTPASLTKLVTALVVLDSKINLNKAVAITQADQDLGACKAGGACIKAKAEVKFSVDGLFHAALMPSANNAASALARSTGLSLGQFAEKMNAKAEALGAGGSHFNEPTGMDPANYVTAAGYAKIVSAAFSNPYLSNIAGQARYSLRSTNNSRYNQTIKNTDKLLANSGLTILGAKTGYLNEAKYNFAALVQNSDGEKMAIVVLGEDHMHTAFSETKTLADLAEQAKIIALTNSNEKVLGTSTQITAINQINN